jgi:hypothetical protein
MSALVGLYGMVVPTYVDFYELFHLFILWAGRSPSQWPWRGGGGGFDG